MLGRGRWFVRLISNQVAPKLTWLLLLFAQFAKPQQPVTVPFLHSSKPFIVIDVSINGHGPYPLVLDTGSNVTAVDASVFEESGLQQVGTSLVTTLKSTNSSYVRGIAKEVALGGLSVRNVEVLEVNGVNYGYIDRRVRGILGENFLDHFDLLIDNEHRQLLFDQGDSLASSFEGEHLPMSQTSIVRESVIHHGPVVSVTLQSYRSSPLRMLLDTGTNQLTFFQTAAKRWSGANADASTALGVGGDLPCETWNDKIRWGKLTLRDVQVASCKNATADKFDVEGYMPTYMFRQILISHAHSYVVPNPVRRSIGTSEIAAVIPRH